MEKTKQILKKYGIGTEEVMGNDKVAYYSVDIKNGNIESNKMESRFFYQKLYPFRKLWISDVSLFVEKFEMQIEKDSIEWEMLKKAELIVENKPMNQHFEIGEEVVAKLRREIETDNLSIEKLKFTVEEKKAICEKLVPGYHLKTMFEPEQAKDDLGEAYNAMIFSLNQKIKRMNLSELKGELFVATLNQLAEAVEKALEQRKEV